MADYKLEKKLTKCAEQLCDSILNRLKQHDFDGLDDRIVKKDFAQFLKEEYKNIANLANQFTEPNSAYGFHSDNYPYYKMLLVSDEVCELFLFVTNEPSQEEKIKGYFKEGYPIFCVAQSKFPSELIKPFFQTSGKIDFLTEDEETEGVEEVKVAIGTQKTERSQLKVGPPGSAPISDINEDEGEAYRIGISICSQFDSPFIQRIIMLRNMPPSKVTFIADMGHCGLKDVSSKLEEYSLHNFFTIMYSMLMAIALIHNRGVRHNDTKEENWIVHRTHHLGSDLIYAQLIDWDHARLESYVANDSSYKLEMRRVAKTILHSLFLVENHPESLLDQAKLKYPAFKSSPELIAEYKEAIKRLKNLLNHIVSFNSKKEPFLLSDDIKLNGTFRNDRDLANTILKEFDSIISKVRVLDNLLARKLYEIDFYSQQSFSNLSVPNEKPPLYEDQLYEKLFNALEHNQLAKLDLLLARNPQIITQAQNCFGEDLLHCAVRIGNERAVDLLLKYNINPEKKNRFGQTPMELAQENIYWPGSDYNMDVRFFSTQKKDKKKILDEEKEADKTRTWKRDPTGVIPNN